MNKNLKQVRVSNYMKLNKYERQCNKNMVI